MLISWDSPGCNLPFPAYIFPQGFPEADWNLSRMQIDAAKILLVDDNPLQGAARQAILVRSGASVLTASGAREALAILGDPLLQGAIGLLVTDHLMPEMNGPELVRQVRQMLPTLPILVLSGLPDAESDYEPGQVLFRLKPFPPTELIRLVKLMLNEQTLRTA